MVVERTNAADNPVEVLDRVLDKGIVIDAWIRVALMGVDLITVEARVVVASIQTYLESSKALALAGAASPIDARPERHQEGLGGNGTPAHARAGRPMVAVARDAHDSLRREATVARTPRRRPLGRVAPCSCRSFTARPRARRTSRGRGRALFRAREFTHGGL